MPPLGHNAIISANSCLVPSKASQFLARQMSCNNLQYCSLKEIAQCLLHLKWAIINSLSNTKLFFFFQFFHLGFFMLFASHYGSTFYCIIAFNWLFPSITTSVMLENTVLSSPMEPTGSARKKWWILQWHARSHSTRKTKGLSYLQISG